MKITQFLVDYSPLIGALVGIALMILAGEYLFLAQLAEYGWKQ